MVKIELPYPPSINHYYGRRPRGGVYIKPKGEAFRADVIARVKSDGLPEVNGFVSATLNIYPPDRRRRDIDNPIKATLDAMQHAGLYEDDCKIKHLECTMHDKDDDGGRVYVTIKGIK